MNYSRDGEVENSHDSEDKDDCRNEGSSRRYCYPPSEKYLQLEHNIAFNVLGGRQCESSIASDFVTSINEVIALQINSEAKFRKVYREGINKCFLMPAEFKDDAMRNFFRRKFEEFVNDSVEVFWELFTYLPAFELKVGECVLWVKCLTKKRDS